MNFRWLAGESALHPSTVAWVEANPRFRERLLGRLRDDGPVPAGALPNDPEVPYTSTGWNDDKNTNRMLEEQGDLLKAKQTEGPAYGEIKRRLGWEWNGMRLHELYFENLGGKGPLARDGSLLVEAQSKRPPASPPPPTGPSSGSTAVRTPPPSKPGLDRAASLLGQVLDGRYQVQKKLGEGGMSYVYLAREVATGHDVAIKVLSPKLATDRSSVERLRREAGLAMRLDHPNVCRILRLGESEDGLIYLVMPFLKGELLSDREVKAGPMRLADGIDVLEQVCLGLHHAHEVQIVHRDLKPENIMLVSEDRGSSRERAVVMDFGLAKERRADPAIAKLTATGIILGTPEFMSPEQIRGRPLDARSDIYALGIVGFEMFTGKLPFQGRNAQEMMIARLRGRPQKLRELRADLPEALEGALARAMETNPDARYNTALEFAEALHGPQRSGFLSKIKEKLT